MAKVLNHIAYNTVRRHERWDLDYIFHPRSVAVVGASTDPTKRGYDYTLGLISMGFKGAIYPINPRGGEMLGLKIYPGLRDVPGPVDYVISCIPARQVVQLMQDCAAVGVKAVQFFTSGFSELGDEAGAKLEAEMVAVARSAGIRVIGPNCMGVYCPESGLCIDPRGSSKQSGPIGFLSQSGGNANEVTRISLSRGVYFSKVVSYGNACDVNETDLLTYFANDPKTGIIGGYIEGVKNGPAFVRALRAATERKPVVILKGGRTNAGSRAVASHTGSLAGSNRVWEALCRQLGVVQVDDLDQMGDMLTALTHFRRPRGRRVGIVGMGGGRSVQAADDCSIVGLEVPPFGEATREALGKHVPDAGTSTRNPVDTITVWQPEQMGEAVKIVAACDDIDFLITHLVVDQIITRHQGRKQLDELAKATIEAARSTDKPIAMVPRSAGAPDGMKASAELRQLCGDAGLATFVTVKDAALSISRLIKYYEKRG